jgi:hypothetical protein
MRNYKDARDFVRGLGLKDTAAWHAYAASDQRPKDIPVNPWVAYRSYFAQTGEKFSINDFIGARAKRGRPRKDENRGTPVKTAKTAKQKTEVQKSAYEMAKDIVRGLNLKSRAAFTELSKNGGRPEGVPARPDLTFAGDEWEGWAAFLGNAPAPERELVNA